MRTLNLTDTNPFYAPAGDECWVLLAKEIMSSYARTYSNQIVVNAFSQAEYDLLDKQKYAPQRRSILRKVKYGPLRSVVDMHAIYSAFEQQRRYNMQSWGIKWRDSYDENIEKL